MKVYSEAAMEKAMKRQEVILRAYAKKLSWIQAAEILGYSPRHIRRIKQRYETDGFHALFDGRIGKASPRRVPITIVEEVLRLYREEYFDFNVSHFHEKLVEKHRIEVSYTWTKCLLPASGLVAKESPRAAHRKKRMRRPLPGRLLHIDGSQHQWFGDERWFDLIVAFQKLLRSQITKNRSGKGKMVTYEVFQNADGLTYELYDATDYDDIKTKNERSYNKKDLFSILYNISKEQEKTMFTLKKNK